MWFCMTNLQIFLKYKNNLPKKTCNTVRYFSARCLHIKHINSCLLSLLFSLVQILGGQTLIFRHAPACLSQRGCSSLGASVKKRISTQNTFSKFPDERVKNTMRTAGEIDFCFCPKLKITLVESTYPSQRPK